MQSNCYYTCQGGYGFIGVSKLVCSQDYAKTTQPKFTKLGGKVAHGPRKKPLDFDRNPDHVTLGILLEYHYGHG